MDIYIYIDTWIFLLPSVSRDVAGCCKQKHPGITQCHGSLGPMFWNQAASISVLAHRSHRSDVNEWSDVKKTPWSWSSSGAGRRCRKEKFRLPVPILQWTCEQQREDRANQPSICVQQSIVRQGRWSQQADTASYAQLPGLLHCCLVIAVMWPHCCHAWHAIGKTMSQEAVARSREKDNENKKEIRAIRLSRSNCM